MLRKNDRSHFPHPTWSLDQLKTWLQATCSKWALNAYWMGKALIYAEKELKEEGQWMEFCRDACPGLSYETIRRYIRLAKAVKDPDKLYGIRLNQAYELTGVVPAKQKPDQPHLVPGKPVSPAAPGGPPESPPADGAAGGPGPDDPEDGGSRGGDDSDVHERGRRPGMTLGFFCLKVCEQLTALHQLPRKERWADLDVEQVRSNLLSLQEQVAWAVTDLPKTRKKAG